VLRGDLAAILPFAAVALSIHKDGCRLSETCDDVCIVSKARLAIAEARFVAARSILGELIALDTDQDNSHRAPLSAGGRSPI
jgi:hypothetical protein